MTQRPERAVEAYYTLADLAARFRMTDRTIRRMIARREFSPGGEVSNIIDTGDGLRIPASGVNYYLDRHPYTQQNKPIKARTVGELRRKAGRFSAVQTFGRKEANGE